MRFRYPLQKIVDLKETEKHHAEWMLSKAVGELHQVEKSLAELATERSDLSNAIEHTVATGSSIAEVMQLQAYANAVEYRMTLAERKVENAVVVVEQRRGELTERMKDEKVWTRAREKAKESFLFFANKKEQEELDEIALTRFARQ